MNQTRAMSLRGKIREWGPELEHAPADAVYCGRRMTMGGWRLPMSRWANPYTIKQAGTAEAAVAAYRDWITAPLQAHLYARIVPDLRGRLLLCWCESGPCHVRDVLVPIADGLEVPHYSSAEGIAPFMPLEPATETVVPVGAWAGAL